MTPEMPMPKKEMKQVTISEAANGYVVSMYGKNGETKVVCKNMAEAHKAVEKMMGNKKMVKRYG